jgi:hypothetical protein
MRGDRAQGKPGRTPQFPEGFADWTFEKQEAWIEKLIRDVWNTKRRMNIASQNTLKMVAPFLANKIYQLSTLMIADPDGVGITVSAGLRTVEEQHALFLMGRDEHGNIVDPKKIVTNADGGHSWHNFGMAVDCAPVEKDGTIDWNAKHPHWILMEQIGERLGLTSGANFKRIHDCPHFQITGRFPVGAPDDEIRQLYKEGGLLAVWAAVEASLPEEPSK